MWSQVLKYETFYFIVPCNGLQSNVAQYAVDQTQTPRRTPSLSDKSTGFSHLHYTTHGTNGFMSHPKDTAIMVSSVLLKDPSVTTRTQTHTLLIRNTRTLNTCISNRQTRKGLNPYKSAISHPHQKYLNQLLVILFAAYSNFLLHELV